MLSGAPGAGRRAQPEIASEIEIKFFFTGPGGDTWLSSWGRMGRSRQGACRQGPGPGALAFIRVCGPVLWGPQARACWSFNPKVPGSGKPQGLHKGRPGRETVAHKDCWGNHGLCGLLSRVCTCMRGQVSV